MMLIDFHTHVYPDRIAARTIEALTSAADTTAYTSGTLDGLLQSMRENGIDMSVVLPVATRAGQFDTINRVAREMNEQHAEIISFGGIHPDDEDVESKLSYLKSNGFRGIKLHPDYQGTFIDDERYIRIIAACWRLGLAVVIHAGKDPAYDVIHCSPDRARRMLDRVYDQTGFSQPFIVFAHLCGANCLDEVEQYLGSQPCYFDISCAFSGLGIFSNASDERIVRFIRTHGAERILFGTDSPWNHQGAYRARFLSLDLSDEEKSLIAEQNARRLLKMHEQ